MAMDWQMHAGEKKDSIVRRHHLFVGSVSLRQKEKEMIRFVCLCVLIVGFVLCAQAQTARGIIPVEFAKARPTKGQAPTNRRTVYRRTSAKALAASKADEVSQLGLTIWRLRP